MALKCPFDAVGVQDFPVAPVVKGQEYTVINVTMNSGGARYQVELADGTTGWFPAKYVEIIEEYNDPGLAPDDLLDFQPASEYQQNNNARTPTKQQQVDRKAQLRQKFETKQRQAADDSNMAAVTQSMKSAQIGAVPTRADTYMTTKGFLANAPGFNTNLDNLKYVDDNVDINADDYPIQPSAQPQPAPQPAPPPVNQITNTPTKSGMYKTVTPSEETHFTPSADLPAQYASNSVVNWVCPSCATENGTSADKCRMCGGMKPSLVTTVTYEKNPGGPWQCIRCTVQNKSDASQCSMCGTKWEPKRVVTPAPKANSPNQAATGPKKSPGGKQKKKIVGKNESGVELEYAKKVDVYNYKTGSTAVPGHGASY